MELTIRNDFDPEGVQNLVDAFNDPDVHVLAFALNGESMTYINKTSIVRIDVD